MTWSWSCTLYSMYICVTWLGFWPQFIIVNGQCVLMQIGSTHNKSLNCIIENVFYIRRTKIIVINLFCTCKRNVVLVFGKISEKKFSFTHLFQYMLVDGKYLPRSNPHQKFNCIKNCFHPISIKLFFSKTNNAQFFVTSLIHGSHSYYLQLIVVRGPFFHHDVKS